MTATFWAPGRVNPIGEHTDYSGGLVLPIAIHLGIELISLVSDAVLEGTLARAGAQGWIVEASAGAGKRTSRRRTDFRRGRA